jgi:glycosyltransferase involved in cell wall biosynthesis
MNSEKLAVVMPVYNEEDALCGVMEAWHDRLTQMGVDFRIFAYNDGSTDSTSAKLHALEPRLDRLVVVDQPNCGHGPTILQGYRRAAEGFDWVFQVDSDGEMAPDRFPQLWAKRVSSDFVLGRRAGRVQPLSRKIVSAVSRWTVWLFFGKAVWDVNSPYRLMRTAAFADLFALLPDQTFAPNVVLTGWAAKRGLRTVEMDVEQHDRQTGEVSIRKWRLLKAAVRSLMQTIRLAFVRVR